MYRTFFLLFPVLAVCFFLVLYTADYFKMTSILQYNETPFEPSFKQNQYTYGIKQGHEHTSQFTDGRGGENDWWKQNDIMAVKPPTFDLRYKNPCWYNGSSFHCLPYVYFLGIRKSGTTDMGVALGLHPEIIKKSSGTIHWFSWRRFDVKRKKIDGFSSYLKKWDKGAKMVQASPTTTDGKTYYNKILLSRTPSPMFFNKYWRMLPGNEGLAEPRYVALDYMKHIVPTAKAIMMLRNPTERLYSDYKYAATVRAPCFDSHKRYQATETDFHNRVLKAIPMYKECFKIQPMRTCLYNETLACSSGLQVRLSIIVGYVKEALRVFGRENFHIVSFERYVKNKTMEMEKLFDFLDLRPFTQAENARLLKMGKHNTAESHGVHIGPMFQKTRNILEDFFAPFNAQLAKLLAEHSYQYKI